MSFLSYLRAILVGVSLRARVAIVVAIAAGGLSATITIVDSSSPAPSPAPTPVVQTTVDGVAEKPGVQPLTLEAPAPVVKAATDEIHTAMSAGAAAATPFPMAAPSQRGCETRIVRNMGSRFGSAVKEIVLHFTAGPNRAGRSDMDGTTTLANNPAAKVSWHFLIDREGNCYFSVPLTMSAWTQANANRFSVGIEIVNAGAHAEPNLIDGKGKAKLALVISDVARDLGIPLQLGRVVGCVPVKPGIVDHAHLGECGGGHVDVTPFPRRGATCQPSWGGARCPQLAERVGPYVRAARAARAPQPTAADRRACEGIHAFRGRRRAGRPGTPTGRARFDRRRDLIRDHGLRCVRGRPSTRA